MVARNSGAPLIVHVDAWQLTPDPTQMQIDIVAVLGVVPLSTPLTTSKYVLPSDDRVCPVFVAIVPELPPISKTVDVSVNNVAFSKNTTIPLKVKIILRFIGRG